MGAQSAQVQSSQSSQPASKGAGQSASNEPASGKGGQMSSMSGQPTMGQPNTNGNTGLATVNPIIQAEPGVLKPNNAYSNTVGIGQKIGGEMNTEGQPIGKGVDSASSVKSGKT
jgi:hypothetical protein